MPQKSKYKIKVKTHGNENIGERIGRLRKEKGYTQVELSQKMGITQVLLSNYERNRLRPNYEVIISIAQALDVTSDEILGLTGVKDVTQKPSLKILRRLNKIEGLPPTQQRSLLQTIDNFLKGVEAQK